MSRDRDSPMTIFLGDLSRNATVEEVEKAFGYYGTLKSVWLSSNPGGFGFIDFQDSRDAADAVKGLDGKTLCGTRVRVEFSHGRNRSKRGERPRRRSGSRSPRSRRRYSPHDVCYECGDRGHYAYDCEIRLRRQRRMRSNSKSRSPKRQRNGHASRRHKKDRRRSRSESDRSNSRSRSRSNSSSRSKERRSRSRSRNNRRD